MGNPLAGIDRQGFIRVLVVDDYAVVRYGLEVFLLAFDDMELVGTAPNGQEAVRLCGQIRPDVVLMDIMMPVMDGITATRLIRQQYPDTQVVAVVSLDEEELAPKMLEAGASSYLLKMASIGDLAKAIRASVAQQLSHEPSEPAISLLLNQQVPVA